MSMFGPIIPDDSNLVRPSYALMLRVSDFPIPDYLKPFIQGLSFRDRYLLLGVCIRLVEIEE